MSSATARIFSLLSTPLPLRHLHHYPPSLLFLSTPRLLLSLSPPPPPSLPLTRRFHFHAQTSTDVQLNDYLPSSSSTNGAAGSSPWPEWYKLINSSQFSRYSGCLHGNLAFDEFVGGGEGLPADFVRSAIACLAFAREHESLLWSLSRKDIEVVVEKGSPFLFKDAVDAMTRMKSFLNGSTANVLGSEKANTVDLMMFLLSYASTTLVSSETNHSDNRGIVAESVRRLFSELAEITGAPESTLPESVPKQFPGTNGQLPRSFEQNVQMKRGDWICPRCRFMNFARNMTCLECEESRPKRQLTGGEWECPQCDFFNYGKNLACLRCDCKKPGMPNRVPGSVYNQYSINESSDKPSTEDQERVQSWFRKISLLENTSNEGNASAAKTLAETMPLKEGVISESSTLKQSGNESQNVQINKRLDEMLAKSTNALGASSSNSTAVGNIGSRSSCATSESASLPYEDFPEIMPMRKGENRFVAREKKDRSLTSPLYKRRMTMEQSGSSSYVPFVPFPPNYFARDKQPVKEESPVENSSMPSSIEKHQHDNPGTAYGLRSSSNQSRAESLPNQQTSAVSWNQRDAGESWNERTTTSVQKQQDYMQQTQNFQGFSNANFHTPGSESKMYSKATSQQPAEDQKATVPWRGSSLEGSAVKEPDPLDMSEEAKAERWFRRVAQIKDIKELSEIPDEDFPSIMPLRKGVNRFVVSKRKTPLERRLASSQYRRKLPVVKSNPPKHDSTNES